MSSCCDEKCNDCGSEITSEDDGKCDACGEPKYIMKCSGCSFSAREHNCDA